MVDDERAGERLDRLEQLVAGLQAVRGQGLEAYVADESTRLATERRLQLAEQICIDLGAQLVSELGLPAPSDYAGIFASLRDGEVIDAELAKRLAEAARQRNLLVHLYLELDDETVFASLERLDDLRAFATAVQRLADR